ncbi:monocyte differentiation antigen CD14 [Phascolarctos cinereus]|uniref:Monocyte differentiation antigen CD14 n=1 Tax=Phascolarctos cinereus TaxID=38626 RepID=A0A6P5LR28_PHACI|nr:monocyte differentiation antigen CD14 [Phascolarctos cinereus]
MEPWQRLPPLLLLYPLLLLPWSSSSTVCILDEEGDNCFCNFSAPEPQWNDIAMCISAVEVEILGGSHNLDVFLQKGGVANPGKAEDVLRVLRLRRLKLREAQVPAPLLNHLLRALTYTRIKELTLEDLVISHPPLQPPSPSDSNVGLTALKLNRVSLVGESNLLAALGPWLKPSLKALNLTGLGLSSVPCPDLGTFKELNSLDLSDNPEIGESGLTGAFCLKEFQALRDLALRNTSLESLGEVCQGLEVTGTNVQHLDISYNELRDTPQTQCTWPPTLISLNLSHSKLKCVPKSLPEKLQQLDLSYNLLMKQPMLPQVNDLILRGNPFADSVTLARLQGEPVPKDCEVPSRGTRSVGTPLALQVSGTAALAMLRGVRVFP